MIRLIALNNPRVAQSFIDYMASRDIEILMTPEGEGQFALWLKQVEHQIEAEAELKLFIENPRAQKYQAASWQVADSRTQQFHYHSPSFISQIKAKAGPLTLAIMVICIAVYALLFFGFGQPLFQSLHFPATPDQKWQLWRWVSHAFLHFSVAHIAFNLLWWWQFGGDIEKKLGSGKLLQIFLLSAALSGAAQYWVEGANFGGLSGVVYALMGYLWIIGWRRPDKGLSVPRPLVIFMLAWLVLGFVQPFMAIANSAHLAGLLAGCGLASLEGQSKAV
ncbi:rhomboid family intramembrane serine protease GlpG [Vibrio rumoiensis]|uniref:rhomboid family intramembrane serine protease GlpG n=1 Tax=Vibrio rumoiensis TaxID=76258 RepID=UPI000B5C9803|nr:rhomboid family intramembrane serine protease GlpG [Vibrio rumoiensis]